MSQARSTRSCMRGVETANRLASCSMPSCLNVNRNVCTNRQTGSVGASPLTRQACRMEAMKISCVPPSSLFKTAHPSGVKHMPAYDMLDTICSSVDPVNPRGIRLPHTCSAQLTQHVSERLRASYAYVMCTLGVRCTCMRYAYVTCALRVRCSHVTCALHV
jgi:hypothetical protein